MKSRIRNLIVNNKVLYLVYKNTIRKLFIIIDNRKMQKRRNEISKYGLSVIKEIDQYINASGIECFVDSGTLLGTVRERKLLSWDYDIDFGIFLTKKHGWDYFETCMTQIGYKKVKQFIYNNDITEQTYKKADILVDFFNHYSDENHSYYYAYIWKQGFLYANLNYMHALRYKTVKITGLKMAKLDSISVHIPKEAEQYLSALYGEDWRIPNPDWKEDGLLPTCEFLEGFGICEKF